MWRGDFQMKKNIFLIGISLTIIFIILIIINETFCFDKKHRKIYPVNPYCTKCHGRDGVVQHECKNPNGRDKYCSSCGKIVINY